MTKFVRFAQFRSRLRTTISSSPFGGVLHYIDAQRLESARRQVRREPWVKLPGSGVRASVAPDDERGVVLALNQGCTDRGLARLWESLVRVVAPQVVLDVGANYGEVSLGCTYRAGTQLHLFEPNPRIATHLRRTLARETIPNPVSLHNVALSGRSGTLTLHVDPAYSGTASLHPSGPLSTKVDVDARPLDDCGLNLVNRRVLMKVDVEGAEGMVFAGAKRTVREAAHFVAVVEFCHLSIGVLSELHRSFEFFCVHPHDLRLEPTNPAGLLARQHDRRVLKDALLIRREPT